MEGFGAYLRIVRYAGRAHPYWTPVAPLHRLVSYFLSYGYVALGLTPLSVTLLGLALAVSGAILAMAFATGGWPFWLGLALLNLGVAHDACDGEVARYRIHHGLQSTRTYRVGMFADFWAYAIVVEALLPVVLGVVALQRGGPWILAALGVAAAFTLLSSYIVGYARRVYWPDPRHSILQESFSLAGGGPRWLATLRRGYFWCFETAMFTTHASLVLGLWVGLGLAPSWPLVYVAAITGGLTLSFLVATAAALRGFDRVQA